MIRNEAEYQEAAQRLKDESQCLRQQEKQLKELNLSKEEIKRVLDPIQSFHLQLKEEVQSYETPETRVSLMKYETSTGWGVCLSPCEFLRG